MKVTRALQQMLHQGHLRYKKFSKLKIGSSVAKMSIPSYLKRNQLYNDDLVTPMSKEARIIYLEDNLSVVFVAKHGK